MTNNKSPKATKSRSRQKKSNSAASSLAVRHQRQADKLRDISSRVTKIEETLARWKLTPRPPAIDEGMSKE